MRRVAVRCNLLSCGWKGRRVVRAVSSLEEADAFRAKPCPRCGGQVLRAWRRQRS